MSPYISFHLTHDSFDRFAELLRPHGIVVRDTWHDSAEDLEASAPSMESYTGFLSFRDAEFSYNRHKSFPGSSIAPFLPPRSHNVEVYSTYLSVDITGHDADSLEQLFQAITAAFPQPERPKRLPFQPRPWTVRRLGKRAGCILAIAIFALICFFAAYGIRMFLFAR